MDKTLTTNLPYRNPDLDKWNIPENKPIEYYEGLFYKGLINGKYLTPKKATGVFKKFLKERGITY